MTAATFISFLFNSCGCCVASVPMCSVHACPVDARRGHPLNWIILSCEPSCGCYELNLGPWKSSHCSKLLNHLSSSKKQRVRENPGALLRFPVPMNYLKALHDCILLGHARLPLLRDSGYNWDTLHI